ncbi:MAG: SRPBCC domain-containing protein [Ferruginibacter sp.]|nr:SRPBCC domain-containing protein [Ferruginibacter sp.]
MRQKEQIAQGKVIDITEVFDTTPERLFKAWTNEKDFAAWFGPEGFDAFYCKLDVRVGGNWKAGIATKEGEEHWFEGEYLEIIENEKLLFTFNHWSEHIIAGEETIVNVRFSKANNQTIMHFNQAVFKTVESGNSHNTGWLSTIICLKNHINKSG